MSKKAEQLLEKFVNYEQLANESLEATAKKKDKKLDPKAKVRNRGTVCVPAESAKDKKDHFPINDEDQARNALARVHQYSSAPEWYKGSLQGLQALVARKVKAKYPKIDVGGKKKDKKATLEYIENLLVAYAQGQQGQQYDPANPFNLNLGQPQGQQPGPYFLGQQQRQLVPGYPLLNLNPNLWQQPGQQGQPPAQPAAQQGQPAAKPAAPARPARAAVTQTEGVDAKAVQQALRNNNMNLGQTGPNRDGVDGDWGKQSEQALQQYMQAFKVPQGTPTKTVKEYLAKGGTGTPPWQQQAAFSAEQVTDQLYTYQGHLKSYQDASKQQKITAQGAPAVRNYMGKIQDWANTSLKAIDEKLKDQKTSDQEKQQLTTLRAQVAQVVTDIGVWNNYLDTKFPRSTWGAGTTANFKLDRMIKKYAQQPMDPTWSGSQQAQPAAQQQGQPAAPQGQPAAPQAQPAQPAPQQARPAQPAPQQGQPAAPQGQPAQPQLSAASKEKWIDWIKDQNKQTHQMIYGGGGFLFWGGRGGIKDFYDKESFSEEVLQDIKDDLTRALGYAKSGDSIKNLLGDEYAMMLDKVKSNINIILGRVDKEIRKREQEEARADRMSRRRF